MNDYQRGNRFGHLIAVKIAEYRKNKTYWLCNCDCGKQIIVEASRLRRGKVTSCGCKK